MEFAFIASIFLIVVFVSCIVLNFPSVALFVLFMGKRVCTRWLHQSCGASEFRIRDFPDVLIQIPTYNEPKVIGRILEAVFELDWPKGRLQVQVLDDSTDSTGNIANEVLASFGESEVQAFVLHREERIGFKAGALQAGLDASDAPYIAILDCDYVPEPNWLRSCVGPLLIDEGLAFVQSRIGFLNREATWFTRGQALLLDVHYVIEQGGRDCLGLVLPFNGTGGVWRRKAIDAVGGWRGDTLVEDMDLSFRAEAKGWRAKYLVNVMVPGELPESVLAWAGQQKRWSMGTAQVTRQRWHDLMHLGTSTRLRVSLAYQLLNIFAGQVSLLAIAFGAAFWMSQPLKLDLVAILFSVVLMLVAIRAVAMPLAAQAMVGNLKWTTILLDLPSYIATTVLGSVFGTSAAIRGLLGQRASFVRTRKTGATAGS